MTGMERSQSGQVFTSPQGAMPSSASMAFPPKKDIPQNGSLRGGSIIQRMGRTASTLFLGRRSSSGEVIPEKVNVPETIPAAAQPSISAPLTTIALKAVTPLVSEKKELIFGKMVYTITHNDQELHVSIEGSCSAVYRVNCLKDFKSDSGHLRQIEVLLFIKRNLDELKQDGPLIHENMQPKERELAAIKVIKSIKKNKDNPLFNRPFYVVRKKIGDHKICVFESDLKEIILEKTKK